MANKVIGFIFMDIIRRWEIPLFDFILSNQNNSLNHTAEIVPTLLKISTRRQMLCLGAESLSYIYYISGDRALDFKVSAKTWRL